MRACNISTILWSFGAILDGTGTMNVCEQHPTRRALLLVQTASAFFFCYSNTSIPERQTDREREREN